MAAKILKPEVKASGILDAMEMGVMKTLAEKAFLPVVGNSSFTSGAAKLVAGGVIDSFTKNKHAKLLGGAIVMDATEDIAHAILKYVTSANGGTQDGF